MKRVIFSTIFVLTLTAQANDNRGYDAAQKVCHSMGFSDRINRCLKDIKDAEFNEEAVGVCQSMGFADTITGCLKTIRNRRYSGDSVANCKNQGFATNITTCLENSGSEKKQEVRHSETHNLEIRPLEMHVGGGSRIDREFILANLRKALRSLREGDEAKAQRLIENTIDGLK